ncbi:MAG: pyruvate dehydrogenase (acetyl-transferring) E1 component subunit alpha [Alphaproteobacteria bacterium]|nr:pyruvate dehydrogenase (acetyl-transferring) E1 component subunit alpha [Alphaproteobacteria bacterium]
MVLIRRFEERAGQLYGLGKIGGFCHLYIGQEAVAVGLFAGAHKNDKHITSYRAHGHMLAAGVDMNLVMAELMGKATGCSKGKGGSMHMFALDKGFYGGHGIVGAQVPIGTGLAFADNYNKKKNATYVYYGDGAAHQGQVYEAFNLAKLWNLPVIYVIENNEYAMGTSLKRSTAVTDLYKRGESFGIPGIQVNGMDVFEVEKAGLKAREHIEKGKGPILMEIKTYRYRGHSMSDPANYRTKDEVQKYRSERDPIVNFKDFLLKKKYFTEEQLKAIENAIRQDVIKCVEFCENSPEPDESELFSDIY